MNLTIRINDFLSGLFLGVGIKLVDFKIEFGRLWENDFMRIVLADEISPDSCRLWDVQTNEKLDKDRFRRDMGGVVEAYSEVAQALWNHARIGARRSQRPDVGEVKICRESEIMTNRMKARVFVTLKNGVLDPQGKAIGHALNGLGLRPGRRSPPGQSHRSRASERDEAKARASLKDMCEKLLANTVIEKYEIELKA